MGQMQLNMQLNVPLEEPLEMSYREPALMSPEHQIDDEGRMIVKMNQDRSPFGNTNQTDVFHASLSSQRL